MNLIMNLKSFVATTLLSLGVFLAVPAFAQATADKKAAPAPTPAESALIAKARADYPLKTCLVSDEPLGSMGEAVAHVHRAAGKPDRVVFVCCEGCIDDFKQDPAKYLKKVDDAAAKTKSGKGKQTEKSAK
jgi:hypothetical protein